ncbi:MAG: pyridoxal-phosphate dependent enzyme [Polyangiaceae bacterium]|jgi:D-cysteine desulfhydrase|nr:pyridoxal-phosphate dependent enzyme [Polyangiaceae bacterium]
MPALLGTYPTPVEPLAPLSSERCALWVKRDDRTHPMYGGNKVRKLEILLADACARGARRIVTFGTVGSHHVLATALHGRSAGLEVAAILTPQPWSAHACANLRAALGAGLQAYPCSRIVRVPVTLARLVRRGDYVMPPGGSSPLGSVGYADAVQELRTQVREGRMPMPTEIVVALGSGGTAAGLLAGVVETGMPVRVVGVRVVDPPLVTRASTLLLARAVARRRSRDVSARQLANQFDMERGFLGAGYGHCTPQGAAAIATAAQLQLQLEPCYTAKAFAAALVRVASGHAPTVLYWHTLSSAPMEPLLAAAPGESDLAPELRALLAGHQARGGA